MKQISSEEFQKFSSRDKYLIVDFFATWCGPCKMLAPVLDKVSQEMTDYEFVKIDVDEEQKLAIENNIYTIPTIVVFKSGKEVARRSGYMSESDFKAFINNNCK